MLSYNKYDMETPIGSSFESIIEHSMLVSNLAFMVSKEMKMDPDFCYDMAMAGMVHDIGKIKIYSYLLQKYDNIMAIDEARYIRMHPSTGYAILKEKGFHDRILSAVLTHHENFDGSGYPNNIKGDSIPLEGRILHVCDCFGALISNCSCGEAFDLDAALDMMINDVKNFDMKVYLTLQNMVYSREFKQILEEFWVE